MKNIKTLMAIGLFLMTLFQTMGAEAALQKGTLAPAFPALEKVSEKPMVILYFFKHKSKSSEKGLAHLKAQYAAYQAAGISVLAISKDDPKTLDQYLAKNPIPFPVIKDDGKISNNYGVRVVFPTTYVLGPGGRITDALEGGGPTSKKFITTVAQRSLQLKKNDLAEKLYTTVLKENPKDGVAQAGLGQLYLKEGKYDRAEATFAKLVKLSAPEAILGKEGLAAIHLKKGETTKAVAIAEEIQKSDPQSGFVHLVKANVLASRGDQDGALTEYNRAIEGKLSRDWQKAEAYNQVGRIHSERGEFEQAESMYQQAVNQNPYSSEILTNRGSLYEKTGEPKKALALYRQALTVDPEDQVAQLLSKRIAQHLDFKEDMARQERIDTLVAGLAERFKSGQAAPVDRSDAWSSRPMTIAFLGLTSKGGGLLREGMADVLQQEIATQLMASERVSVVEREILEKLLTELKLGSSELADPETALKLGKILAARLIVTGNLVQVPGGVRLSLRVIDPETTAVKMTYSDEMNPDRSLLQLADVSGKILSQRIKILYPLRGKIALVDEGEQVIVNLGRKHGIKMGVQMKIIAEGEAVVVDGKTIGHRKKKVGRLEIVEVEEAMSYGRLTEKIATIQKDQKVLEDVDEKKKSF
ncbi:hypothetical protein MNBD_NITROSPIRAE01-906 [hydrothermal vent metagenome]|uniref:Uncharacterized protein n=1 Tax=hydrothermal vent metagenome TaxID=652676 RepID=A0A3B1CRD8_9ZZZZ